MIGRRPIRSESAPAIGETSIGVPKKGSSRSPVETGEYPRANWNSWVIRNAAAKVAPDIRNVVRLPTAKARLRNIRNGSIGSRTRLLPPDQRQQQCATGHHGADDLRAQPTGIVGPHQSPDQGDDAGGDQVTPTRSSRSGAP